MGVRSVRKLTIATFAMLLALNAAADTSSPSTCSLQEIKDWVEKSRIFSVLAPHYPPIARGLGQKGRVLLNVTLDVERRIESAFLRYPSGHKELDEGVLDMVLSKTGIKLGAPACASEGQLFSFDIPLSFQFNEGRMVAKRELLLEFFQAANALDLAVLLSPKLTHTLFSNLRERYSNVSPEALEIIDQEIKQMIKKEMSPGGAYFEKMIEIHQTHYSEDEIRNLLSFYHTALGRKVARTNTLIEMEMRGFGEHWGVGVVLLSVDRINARLSERGLPYRLAPGKPGTEASPGIRQSPTFRQL